MSLGSRYRFEEMQSNDLNKKEEQSANYFPSPSVRNLCFELPNKSSIFLNYGYLVSCEYKPQDGIIRIAFTSHVVVLTGTNLDIVYTELLDHLPRKLTCISSRYQQLENESKPVIQNIEVLPNE